MARQQLTPTPDSKKTLKGTSNCENGSSGNSSASECCEDLNEISNAAQAVSLHRNLVRTLKADVFAKYEVINLIGTGSMGTVSTVRIRNEKIGGSAYECQTRGVFGFMRKKRVLTPIQDRPKESHDYLYALKTIKLDRMSATYIEELVNEISILKTLDHPNIIKAYEVYHSRQKNQQYIGTQEQIYCVLELCTGSDLFARAPYSQREAARIVAQVVSAVNYLHSHNVVHRDLKYENVLFENTSPTADVKIIDFGLSKKFFGGKPEWMTERVGTIYTMAPQVLQGVYSSQADMWSLGVITYMLLSSEKPFFHNKRKHLIDQIMRGTPQYDTAVWETIDDSAKDFVRNLIVVDPKKRMTAATASKHAWIVNRERLPNEKPREDTLQRIFNNSLMQYKYTSDLKKLALQLIAHKSTTSEIFELRKVFESFDRERLGVLTIQEFRKGLQELHYSDEVIEEIFSNIDVNHHGHILYTEFLAATIEAKGRIEEDRIAEAFDHIDSEGTGYITKRNLMNVLGPDCSSDLVDRIMKESDDNKDGKITYNEFLRNFRQSNYEMAKKIGVIEENDKSQRSQKLEDMDEKYLLGLDAIIPGGRFEIDMLLTH